MAKELYISAIRRVEISPHKEDISHFKVHYMVDGVFKREGQVFDKKFMIELSSVNRLYAAKFDDQIGKWKIASRVTLLISIDGRVHLRGYNSRNKKITLENLDQF